MSDAQQDMAQATYTLDQLWFTLDQIDAVARSIDLVQEHVSDPIERSGQTGALAGVVRGLVGIAHTQRNAIVKVLDTA